MGTSSIESSGWGSKHESADWPGHPTELSTRQQEQPGHNERQPGQPGKKMQMYHDSMKKHMDNKYME
jgi:hypothetical protein